MLVDLKKLSPDAAYFLMIQTIVPRPIAWVLSDNGNATYNLAPFSFFNGVASEPPLLLLSIGWKDQDIRKDTWVNIEQRQDFVVHIPPAEMVEPMVASSATLAHGVSEVTDLQLQLERVEGWSLPRVVGPKAALFCKKYRIIEIGTAPQALILGEIQSIWFAPGVAQENKGRLIVDYNTLNPVARLGGHQYALPGPLISLKRPE